MLGPNYKFLTSGYHPAYQGETLYFKLTVTNAATRLGTLIGGSGIPLIVDEMWTGPISNVPAVKKRPPWHVFFQVVAAAANPVYMTFDNVTAPVVGGPGMELEPGTIYKFESAGESLLRLNSGGIYPCPVTSAFQLIAVGNTVMNCWFAD